jgi:hypothetical protein
MRITCFATGMAGTDELEQARLVPHSLWTLTKRQI